MAKTKDTYYHWTVDVLVTRKVDHPPENAPREKWKAYWDDDHRMNEERRAKRKLLRDAGFKTVYHKTEAAALKDKAAWEAKVGFELGTFKGFFL